MFERDNSIGFIFLYWMRENVCQNIRLHYDILWASSQSVCTQSAPKNHGFRCPQVEKSQMLSTKIESFNGTNDFQTGSVSNTYLFQPTNRQSASVMLFLRSFDAMLIIIFIRKMLALDCTKPTIPYQWAFKLYSSNENHLGAAKFSVLWNNIEHYYGMRNAQMINSNWM